MFTRLSTRLAVLAMAASACIALVGAVVGVQLAREAEIDRARHRLMDAVETQREGLAQSLWNFDDAQIRAQLVGLLHMPYVVRAEVISREGDSWAAGGELRAGSKPAELSLARAVGGTDERLGALVVWYDFGELESTSGSLENVTLAVAIAASLVSGLVVLVLFQRLIGRHLSALAGFLGDYGRRHGRPSSFRFARSRARQEGDELDRIEAALDRMLRTERELRGHRDPLGGGAGELHGRVRPVRCRGSPGLRQPHVPEDVRRHRVGAGAGGHLRGGGQGGGGSR